MAKEDRLVLRFSCEATLNIAKRPESWPGMRRGFLSTIFCGIETPDPVALKAMHKDHNMMVPIMEGIRTINSFGMEVVSGIILGLDTTSPKPARISRVHRGVANPALDHQPSAGASKTPLWDRLMRENRLIEDEGRESNVDFSLALRRLLRTWRACMVAPINPASSWRATNINPQNYPNQIKRPRLGNRLLAKRQARPDDVA